MYVQLLFVSLLIVQVVHAQAPVTNSSQPEKMFGQILPKQSLTYDDYDLNDIKSSGNRIEGSGGAASLDEYADDEEDEQLAKITATTTRATVTTTSTVSTTTTTTMTTSTMMRTTVRSTTAPIRQTSSTTSSTTMKWMKSTVPSEPSRKKINAASGIASNFNDLDNNEFKEDQEEYGDDLDDDSYYNEPVPSNRPPMSAPSTTRFSMLSTRANLPANNDTTPLWILFSFLTRPPIAAGILAGKICSSMCDDEKQFDFHLGLAIGILTSMILLICIIRRYHRREKSHSSYTTGLLYPNHYGYSKSPQEFYA